MKKNKLIAFVDLDGTLLREDKKISDYNKEVITDFSSAGHQVVLCSGRYSGFVKEKASLIDGSDYIISDNGALVYNFKTKEIIYESPIEENILKKFLDYAEEKKLAIILNCFEKRYRNNYSDHDELGLIELKTFNEKVYQIIVSSYDFDLAQAIEEDINNMNSFTINYKSIHLLLNKLNDGGYGYDLNTVGSSKGNGIKELLKYFEIEKAQTIAIGDHFNDISMFKEVSIKVAMANSYSSLKEKANVITDTNDNDGVAKLLDKLMKLEKET